MYPDLLNQSWKFSEFCFKTFFTICLTWHKSFKLKFILSCSKPCHSTSIATENIQNRLSNRNEFWLAPIITRTVFAFQKMHPFSNEGNAERQRACSSQSKFFLLKIFWPVDLSILITGMSPVLALGFLMEVFTLIVFRIEISVSKDQNLCHILP